MKKARSSSLCTIENVNPNDVSVTLEEFSTSRTRERRKRVLTDEVCYELREIFELYMDLDTFRVSVRQLPDMMRVYGYHPSEKEYLHLLSVCEIYQRDDYLTYDRFEKVMTKLIMQRNAASGIMKAFDLFDIYNDGFITFTTLCDVNNMLGGHFSDDDILEMIVEADLDKDGVINVHEFAAMMKKTDIEW